MPEKERKIKIFPRTALGKWSVIFIVIFIFLFVILNLIIKLISDAYGPREEQTFFNNPLGISMLFVIASGILSFFTGIISIIWKKERAILVFLSSLIGLLVLWFVIGGTLVPH